MADTVTSAFPIWTFSLNLLNFTKLDLHDKNSRYFVFYDKNIIFLVSYNYKQHNKLENSPPRVKDLVLSYNLLQSKISCMMGERRGGGGRGGGELAMSNFQRQPSKPKSKLKFSFSGRGSGL